MSAANEITERIESDLKQAMRDRNETAKLTLRALKTALTELAKPSDIHSLSGEQVQTVLRRQVKQRRDSAAEFEKAHDAARTQAELAEVAIIETYLPTQMAAEAIEQLARAAITEIGATSPKEMGKVMALLMPRTQGQADGKAVSAIVKKLLEG